MSNLELVQKRDEAAEAYYEGSPILSDEAFDALTLELEEQGTDQTVGHGYEPVGRKVAHDHPMLSLNKVRTISDILSWVRASSIDKILIQHKYDGLAISIKYDAAGNLIAGATRGNGNVGEDVTESVKSMAANNRIPTKIDPTIAPVEIRGEIMMIQSKFDAMNSELRAQGNEPMANKRNAAAGVLRRLDTADAGKFLSLFVYDFPEDVTAKQLIEAGFTVTPSHEVEATEEAIQRDIAGIAAERTSLGYDIDGIVLKVASKKLRINLGNSRTSPNWAIAYKFPNISFPTTLRKVTWYTGRTGRIVPVATYDELIIGGSRFTEATLHNYQYLKEMKLRLGDTIALTRSNDVIPYIIGRVGKHSEDSKRYKVPHKCPNCGADVRVKGQDIVCVTNGACNVISSVVYSLTMLDVLGVSGALVRALRASGERIENVLDLLAVPEATIAQLDGFGETSAAKAVQAMRVVWDASLASWISAIGIPNVGYSTSAMLETKYPSLLEVAEAKIEDLVELPNIGWSKATAIVNAQTQIMEWAVRLEHDFGFSPKPYVREEPVGNAFSGKNVVVTGKLPTLNRAEASSHVIDQGGVSQTSVNGTTNLLIVGENVGATKINAARARGVKIMSGDEFEAIVLGG